MFTLKDGFEFGRLARRGIDAARSELRGAEIPEVPFLPPGEPCFQHYLLRKLSSLRSGLSCEDSGFSVAVIVDEGYLS